MVEGMRNLYEKGIKPLLRCGFYGSWAGFYSLKKMKKYVVTTIDLDHVIQV